MNVTKSAKIALAQKGAKIKDLAVATGTTPAYMSQIINGRVRVSDERLKAMADYFDMKVSEFIALGE